MRDYKLISADSHINEPPDLPILKARRRLNAEVLSALIELGKTTGYGYDQQAWKHWRFQQNQQAFAEQAGGVKVRRGE